MARPTHDGRARLLMWIAWLTVITALVGGTTATAAPTREGPLNVVLILADDLGWSDLACYGADLHETPHLDRLAADGVRFTAAYAASICSPTRASLLTGKHHARLQMTIWRERSLNPPRDQKLLTPPSVSNLPHSEVTIAEVLQAAGYRTGLFGKWHLGAAEHYPETQGFDVNVGGTLWGAPATYFFPYRGLFNDEIRYVPHLADGAAGEYLTDRLTDEALQFIERAGTQPFFLYLAHYAPHTPLEARPELIAHYESRLHPGLRHRNATYAAMVHSLDESVGRVLDCLEQQGIAERTLVVFLSDNGGYLRTGNTEVTNNEPLRSGKGSLYEGGVRVPLIVRWPGVTAAAGRCDEPVSVADLYPTLLEAAGLAGDAAHNAQLDGLSLAPLLTDPAATLERAAIFHHYPHYYATTTPAGGVRAGDWKLLEYFEDGRLELYNLQDDLSESRNLADAMPDKCRELHELLRQWRREVGALLPTPNPDAP